MSRTTHDSNLLFTALLLAFLATLALSAIPCHAESWQSIKERSVRRERVSGEVWENLRIAWEHGDQMALMELSDSMAPYIQAEDILLVRPAHRSDLIVGHVYGYMYESQLTGIRMEVFHQLVRVSGDMLLFRGSNNAGFDPWTNRMNVRSDVVRVLATR